MQQRKTSVIPAAPVARILMNSGAKRVSAEAARTFGDLLYEKAFKIAEKSAMIAKHSGRKTVQSDDIRLAVRK